MSILILLESAGREVKTSYKAVWVLQTFFPLQMERCCCSQSDFPKQGHGLATIEMDLVSQKSCFLCCHLTQVEPVPTLQVQITANVMRNILCTDLCSCVIAWHVFGPLLVPSDRCVNGFVGIIILKLRANSFPPSITLLEKISQQFAFAAEEVKLIRTLAVAPLLEEAFLSCISIFRATELASLLKWSKRRVELWQRENNGLRSGSSGT